MASERQALKHRVTSSSRLRKTKGYGSMDNVIDVNESDSDGAAIPIPIEQKKFNEIENCGEFCEWIKTDTFSKLKFIFFYIALFIPPLNAFYYFLMEEYLNGYIIAGIFGFCLSMYGFNHFRLLFALKAEIDLFEQQNNRFRAERKALRRDVNKVKQCKNGLKYTHQRLENSNKKMINMIAKFERLEDELNALNLKSTDEITQIGSKANGLRRKYYDISLQQQRTILWRLFERLERSGDKKGITREDYDIFFSLLTQEYQDRFERLGGFDALLEIGDGGNKNYIDAMDFEKALSVYAQMHVENVDIKFKIERKESGHPSEDEPQYVRKVTVLKKTKHKGFYLTAQQIWDEAKLQEIGESDEDEPPFMTEQPIFRKKGLHEDTI